jgi:hypothetical protein
MVCYEDRRGIALSLVLAAGAFSAGCCSAPPDTWQDVPVDLGGADAIYVPNSLPKPVCDRLCPDPTGHDAAFTKSTGSFSGCDLVKTDAGIVLRCLWVHGNCG